MSTAGVAFVALGCRVSRAELDALAGRLERAGCAVCAPEEASAIVVNTCAVTGEAEAKTRKRIRHLAGLPLGPLVVATGCAATLFPDRVAGLAPNVEVPSSRDELVARVLAHVGLDGAAGADGNRAAAGRVTATGRTRPGVKIQDGCDMRCSYCIVWKARGPSRSLAPEKAVAAVEEQVRAGAWEVVLTGINLGTYRGETSQGRVLGIADLIDAILERTDVGRLRLSSIEPPDVTDDLVRVMARAGERVAPFLHVCLQSGCDATLGRMRRPYDTALYERVVDRARETLPHLSLGTDLIVGFPGETEGEFEASRAFCERMRFSRMHVFRYSPRPGTTAAEADEQVEAPEKARRAARMRTLAAEMRLAEARRCVGRPEVALVQEAGRGVTGGLFDVRVDPDLAVGRPARVVPRDVDAHAVLDARSA